MGYFATSLSATFKKAQHFGFCIEARVYLGRSKDEPRHPPSGLSLRSLNSECYDSVHIDRGWKGGDEYVVYANDQMPKAQYRQVECRKRDWQNVCVGRPVRRR